MQGFFSRLTFVHTLIDLDTDNMLLRSEYLRKLTESNIVIAVYSSFPTVISIISLNV